MSLTRAVGRGTAAVDTPERKVTGDLLGHRVLPGQWKQTLLG
jgi:hypothetical protein